jgi:hypothetical protein
MTTTNKKRKPVIILERGTHIALFFYSSLFLLLSTIYFLKNSHTSYIFMLGGLIFLLLQFYFMFYQKKLILTKNKIYLYSRGKKIFGWDLITEFLYVNYNQKKIAKILNYGELIIVNQKNESYTYYFLNDCQNFYEKIIEQYENEMVLFDHTYIKTHINNTDTITKKIDTIDK